MASAAPPKRPKTEKEREIELLLSMEDEGSQSGKDVPATKKLEGLLKDRSKLDPGRLKWWK